MYLKVYNDCGTINKYEIREELFNDKTLKDKILFISSSKKENNALDILKAYFSKSKAILFDSTNKTIVEKLNNFEEKELLEKDYSFLFFTSGTTGNPLGALKTNSNIVREIEVQTKILKDYNIKRVIVTVPFIHFYGALIGLFYPLLNGIDIILKEHFLPNDLLDFVDENSLVVTTPLYIKSLNRLSTKKDLTKSLFVSSTAPLFADDAKNFNKKYNCNIMQLFGSTETGGISYKFNDEEFWTPLENVLISENQDKELKIKSPYVSNIVYENRFKTTDGEIQTFDFVEIKDNKFKLIGRSSQILKLAGKRYSTIQIENILEELDGINKALVIVENSKTNQKEEILHITLESTIIYKRTEIIKILKDKLSNLKFPIVLDYVDKIKTSAMGKKLNIQD